MTKSLLLSTLVCGLFIGCSTTPPGMTPVLIQTAVTTGVELGVLQDPTAVPYIRAVTPVVCAAANGTNVSPAEVVAAIQSSPADTLKTPQAIIIINGVLAIYETVWDALGTNTAAAKAYLGAVCNGLTTALPPVGARLRIVAIPPHVH